jgi:glycosyltransferase involved in cell wall biosynthesis
MTHIAHLSSVHPRFSTRIFNKMCRSLVASGLEVSFVVADGKGDTVDSGVQILDAGASKSRLNRMLNAPKRLLHKALALDADLYHLHDPELIPIGLRLKKLGKCVVLDVHEDVPKQLLTKPYLNKPLLFMLSRAFGVYESWACRQFNALVCATPAIREKFSRVNTVAVDINNFPLDSELFIGSISKKQVEVCYVGGISGIRGIREVCAALPMLQTSTRLNLCGLFSEPSLEQTVRAMPGWKLVNMLGFLNRAGVRDILGRSVAGLVTFHPSPNHVDAQPNKMFEYMSAGIPVIASDFPLWREIILGNQCGLCVNPMDPAAIARAIDYLVCNPNEARRMGENGRRAVIDKYNWSIEEVKLLSLYDQILKL